MIGWLGVVIAAIGVPLVLQQTYQHVLGPRRKATKLRRLYTLVEEWHDYVDRNLEAGINHSHLNSLEQKVSTYIKDQRLGRILIKYDDAFRRQYLADIGVREGFRDDVTLFRRYSRAHTDAVDIATWWMLLAGSAWRFLGNYARKAPETNWADIQAQVRVLKQFSGARAEGQGGTPHNCR